MTYACGFFLCSPLWPLTLSPRLARPFPPRPSFHLAKDCGFKVVSHMMPDLPNCDYERDLEGFKEYFER